MRCAMCIGMFHAVTATSSLAISTVLCHDLRIKMNEFSEDIDDVAVVFGCPHVVVCSNVNFGVDTVFLHCHDAAFGLFH